MKKRFLFIFFIIFLTLAHYVYAQGGWFDFTGYYDLGQFYLDNYTWFDFFVFFLIFGGAAKAVFERRFPGAGGQALGIGLGLGLSFGLLSWESQRGVPLFRMIANRWVALSVLALAGIMLFWFLHKRRGGRGLGFFWALLISIFVILFLLFVLQNAGAIELPDTMREINEVLLPLFLILLIIGFIFRRRRGDRGMDGGREMDPGRSEREMYRDKLKQERWLFKKQEKQKEKERKEQPGRPGRLRRGLGATGRGVGRGGRGIFSLFRRRPRRPPQGHSQQGSPSNNIEQQRQQQRRKTEAELQSKYDYYRNEVTRILNYTFRLI